MVRDYAVAPGEYLEEWLEENPEITQKQLADDLGISRKQVNAILRGRAPISAQVAMRLEKVTPISSRAWLVYQAQFDSDTARLEEEHELATHADEISPQVAKYLREIGATEATKRNPGRLYADLLAHVGCGSYEVFRHRCDEVFDGTGAVAALKESGRDVDPMALLAWVAQAEKSDAFKTLSRTCYSKQGLLDVIPHIRNRVAYPDATMLAEIQEMLADKGVVLVDCKAPEKFPLHGVTYWKDDTPIVLFTERRRTDGYIVWAIFHELGHVACDERSGGEYGLVKSKAQIAREEKAANEFARETLFGSEGLRPFKGLTRSVDISRVAQSIGVSPGVAVAEMHKRRMLDYSYGNDLMVDLVG